MKKMIAFSLIFILLLSALAGCKQVYDDPASDIKEISRDDAVEEMDAILSRVNVYQQDAPVDLDMVDYSNEADALADSPSRCRAQARSTLKLPPTRSSPPTRPMTG